MVTETNYRLKTVKSPSEFNKVKENLFYIYFLTANLWYRAQLQEDLLQGVF